MQVQQYYSDDYAGLESGNHKFYYGYEVEDCLNGDWCFQVMKNGKEDYRITRSEIDKEITDGQLDTPQDYLLAGIGIYLLLRY